MPEGSLLQLLYHLISDNILTSPCVFGVFLQLKDETSSGQLNSHGFVQAAESGGFLRHWRGAGKVSLKKKDKTSDWKIMRQNKCGWVA